MEEVREKKALEHIAALFSENRYDMVMMKRVLEGHTGTALVDSLSKPRVARLDTGSFTILGGDPTECETMAMIKARPINYVTPENELWQAVLENIYQSTI